jgi:cytochrome c oxidase subunit 3
MSPENTILSRDKAILTDEERDELQLTALVREKLEPHFRDLEQQHEVAALGMWVFLATEVLFFGALFLGVGVYRFSYEQAFDAASHKLNWIIGAINTLVLLTSSLFMVLAVHYARLGSSRRTTFFLCLTAALGLCFLCLKGLEYYTDYRDNLIPGWKFDDHEWIEKEHLRPDQVPHVKLFLLFYWIMTGLHATHVTIGILVVGVMIVLSAKGYFSSAYYSPVDVTGLYWHFVDIVWLFLFPLLYLMATHTMNDFHF